MQGQRQALVRGTPKEVHALQTKRVCLLRHFRGHGTHPRLAAPLPGIDSAFETCREAHRRGNTNPETCARLPRRRKQITLLCGWWPPARRSPTAALAAAVTACAHARLRGVVSVEAVVPEARVCARRAARSRSSDLVWTPLQDWHWDTYSPRVGVSARWRRRPVAMSNASH